MSIPSVTSPWSGGGGTSQTNQRPANASLDICMAKYEEYAAPIGELYCPWTWDQVLCWPPTKAGTTATQRCPRDKGIDPTKFATKRCSVDGRWEGKVSGDYTTPQGWTNYTPCYTPEMLELFKKLYTGSEEAARMKLDIAEKTRTLEIVGFSVSLAALVISLAIFCHFRSLRNNRTRIHKNLFVAMVIQVLIRLTLYIDQALIRSGSEHRANTIRHGIDNTSGLCEASYVLLEYARTAMFMWMFIEGLYLHNMVTVTVFQEKSYIPMYTAIGWGVPVAMTTAWAIATYYNMGTTKCWWGYNLTLFFWILEGPRMAVILLNFLFLLNIIRVLVVKLRQSHTSETEQVRKAVRAAVVLLPLLGITNLLNMAEAPLDRSVWEFAIWSYGTHFLTSFQGLIIAFLYCFLNGEVRMAVAKSVSTYLSLRPHHFTPRHNSAYVSGVYTEQMVPLPTASVLHPPPCWLRLCCTRPTPPEPAIPETRV
ncbi:PDF receptor isoform X1 [Homalodisca vitripennis]|uniref:PDF receptor isoform X1 n=2 Tax=Homalodisca vitripennis TaxID=197043 RepID=UPI001EECF14E|nr:PDF receptor isoform X1 [Homalodisca vitripennis]